MTEKQITDVAGVAVGTTGKMLSTGSTLLNLAMSGNPHGALLPGHYYYFVGDSDSGKTFLTMTCCAEAQLHEFFRKYRTIYDNAEDGMLMDTDRLFGEAMSDKLEPPARDAKGDPVFSYTIEELYYHLDDAVKAGKPFIYILDSMDALTSDAADKKFEQQKKAYRKSQARKAGEDTEEKVEKVAGSYGDGKAKKNSENLRKLMKGLRETGSILIIISQTRDNPADIYGRKTHSGGRSLKFYATTEIWTKPAGAIKKNVNDKDRVVGTTVQMDVRKNRITGQYHSVTMDIYPSFGLDDLGSCVDFLVEEGWWPITKQTINAKGLHIEGTREKIIRRVEQHSMEAELRTICGECWADIQAKCTLQRKNRYASVAEDPADE